MHAQSITPLCSFVSALRRLPVSSEGSEALHTALKPLLLSVEATEEKYRQELPLILQNGGGAGEIEESMMWFSWSREKRQPDENSDGNDDSGNADEEVWKKAWMKRMERRELVPFNASLLEFLAQHFYRVQVQILLYLHLLSVPCPKQNTPPASPSKKRRREIQESSSLDPGAAIGPPPKKRRKRYLPTPPIQVFPPTASIEAAMASDPASLTQLIGDMDQALTMEDRVELFMDKLCIWQLLGRIAMPDSSHTVLHSTAKDQRDWMQVFCEDVVEPL